MEQGGILLVQPEQILSAKLMESECHATSRTAVGRPLLKPKHLLTNIRVILLTKMMRALALSSSLSTQWETSGQST